MTADPMEPADGPPFYPHGGTYADLLCWHLEYWGTRPTGGTVFNSKPWDRKAFRYAAFGKDAEESTNVSGISNWCGKGSAPSLETAKKIEKALFGEEGENPAFDAWRNDLRRFRKNSQGPGKNSRTQEFPAPPTPPPPFSFKAVPPPTTYFTGRDPEVEKLVAALLPASPNAAVLVQGGPGIGKSTLTQKVAHDLRIITRFGQARRCFVQLETAHSAKAMQEAIAVAMGSDPSKPFAVILKELQDKPALFILDNLETPWEKPKDLDGRRETEATLAALSAIPGIVILASFRGRDAVGGPHWTLRHHVEPLAPCDAGKLFCGIAGDLVPDDANLQQLLSLLGGIPLAIELVATLAGDGTPLTEILRRWTDVGTELACHPDFDKGRLTSLPHSIELSLKSPRLSPDGYGLFQLLGQLPAGLAEADRDALFGGTGMQAASSLARTGLGVRRDARIDLLPPIRDHASRHHLPTDTANAMWTKHFAQLAEGLVDKAFSADGKDMRGRIISETPNIEAAIGFAIRHPAMLDTAITAARHYRRLLTHTGMGTTALLQATADACQRAGDSISEAKVCVQIGILAQERGDLDGAWQTLERGLAANHRASNAADVSNGKGDCIYRMADIHLHRSKLADAQNLYQQAMGFFTTTDNARGLGDCIYRLGDIAWRRGHYQKAMAYVDKAEPEFRRAKFDLGDANCAWLRARIALDAGDYENSQRLHAIARQRFEEIGVPLGLAHCRNGEGYIALGCGQLPRARECFEDAGKMYLDIKDERGMANCYLGLAKLCRREGDDAAAKEMAGKALDIYSRAEVIDCVARCYEEIATLCKEPRERINLATEAKKFYLIAGLEEDCKRVSSNFILIS